MKKIFISLGSNYGQRQEMLEKAIQLFQNHDFVLFEQVTVFYESEVWGKRDQAAFLNAVMSARTMLSPGELLAFCQKIEKKLGRVCKADFGPRCIDLDILLYGEDVICEENLMIPHPLLHERAFVLKGLNELAPDLKHPLLSLSMSELYERIENNDS